MKSKQKFGHELIKLAQNLKIKQKKLPLPAMSLIESYGFPCKFCQKRLLIWAI